MNFSVYRRFLVLLIPFLLLLWFTQSNALFSDTVQFAGDVPMWYYHNGFSSFLLPDYCDSGHPPGFGMYIAAMWQLFGKSLVTSHWAMLPFVMLLVFQSVKLGINIFPKSKSGSLWLTLLLLFQTPLFAHCSLVSPDIAVLGLSFWMLNAIIKKNNTALAIAVFLVALISIRGMTIAVCLYLFKCCLDYWQHPSTEKWLLRLWKNIQPFLWGGLIGLTYFIYHYYQKGWITPTDDTPWGPAFYKVNFAGWVKNLAILVWRLVDLGGIAACLLFLLGSWGYWKHKASLKTDNIPPNFIKGLLVLGSILLVFTLLPLTLYLGLLTQRYLIFFSVIILLLGFILVWNNHYWTIKTKNILVASALLIQLSGSFWIYPATLSQSWDCSLSHLPYYDLRQEFLLYMDEQNIDKQQVITEFPMQKSASVLDYATDTFTYTLLNVVTLEEVEYLWYSSVCNALLKEKAYFDTHYDVLKYAKKGSVEMILYKRK